MAITVTDNRTESTNADAESLTNWTSNESPALFSSEPNPKEGTNSIGMVVSTETSYAYVDITSADMSAGTLIYVWQFNFAILDTTTNGGITIAVSDGTNTAGYKIMGSDKAVFGHSVGQPKWQCMVLDTAVLPASPLDLENTAASLDDTAVTGLGVGFKTLSKALGNTENCYVDVVRYGNGGLTITGDDTTGESGLGWIEDIAILDAASTAGGAYGICRAVGEGVYGFQGQILLGDVGSGNDDLNITDQTFLFEDRLLDINKYGLTIQGGSGTNNFTISNSNLLVPVGVGAFLLATDADVESLDIAGTAFTNWDQGFDLSADVTNAPNHDISGNNFTGCAQLNIGKTAFSNNSFVNSGHGTDEGAMLIDSATSLTNVSNLNFTKDAAALGHAIKITATGAYDLINFNYTGYEGTSTEATIFNDSGGLVTLSPTGGGSITVRNGTSASTVIDNSQTVSITVRDQAGDVIENARVFVEAGATGDEPSYDSVTIISTGTTATVTHTSHGMATNEWVTIRGANEIDYIGTYQITVSDVDTYDYTMGGDPVDTATGTITSTLNVISKLTNASGIAAESFNYASDQQIQGYVRKSTSTPFYKSAVINGTIISTGFVSGVTLVGDE
jgi:hypothetical protein